jgi:hypothetical protein
MSWDRVLPDSDSQPKAAILPANEQALVEVLSDQGLKAYRRNIQLRMAPSCLQQETRPILADMARVSRKAAGDLHRRASPQGACCRVARPVAERPAKSFLEVWSCGHGTCAACGRAGAARPVSQASPIPPDWFAAGWLSAGCNDARRCGRRW